MLKIKKLVHRSNTDQYTHTQTNGLKNLFPIQRNLHACLANKFNSFEFFFQGSNKKKKKVCKKREIKIGSYNMWKFHA